MQPKSLAVLLIACTCAGAAWLVGRNDAVPHDPLAPVVEEGERKPAVHDGVPEKYRETIAKGLAYLVKQQHANGHWVGDDGQHPMAMTGLVGLALLMDKDTPTGRLAPSKQHKHIEPLRKAVNWLLEKRKTGGDGLLFSGHPSERTRYMEGHGLATILLAGALNKETGERRARLAEALEHAVKVIAKAQSTQGGWYHTSKVEGHDFDAVLPTAIQVQALQAAENAGIAIPGGALRAGYEYLTAIATKARPGKDGSLLPIAAALVYVNGPKHADSEATEWDRQFAATRSLLPIGASLKFGRDDLTHYYFAQAAFHQGKDVWPQYRNALFDQVQAAQNKDGSWPASTGLGVGSVYATALWCTVLQLERESHSSMAPRIVIID